VKDLRQIVRITQESGEGAARADEVEVGKR
jgi:hypothetical protein